MSPTSHVNIASKQCAVPISPSRRSSCAWPVVSRHRRLHKHRDNPDEIRRRTAEATETMRRDTKAVVEGVKEGMGHQQAININERRVKICSTCPV